MKEKLIITGIIIGALAVFAFIGLFSYAMASPSIASSNLIQKLESQGADFVILDIHQGLGIYYPIEPDYEILGDGAIRCDVIIAEDGTTTQRVFTEWVEIRDYQH